MTSPLRKPPPDRVALDQPIRDLLHRVTAATHNGVPDLVAIGQALVELARDGDYLGDWVDRLDGRPGTVSIHAPTRGPRLALVHRADGQMSAIHDHGTWVALAPITGVETHRRWRVVGEQAWRRVEVAEHAELVPAEVATLLPPDDLHDHGHLAVDRQPAQILVLLGDDQTRHRRNEWDAKTGDHRVLLPGDPGRWLAEEPVPLEARRTATDH